HDYPCFGLGAGNLKTSFALYQARVNQKMNLSLKGTSESNVHNEYLQMATELGLVGLLSFCFIFINWFYLYFKSWEPQQEIPESAGMALGVVAFLFYCLSNFPYDLPSTSCLVIFFLAVSLTGIPLKEHSRNLKEN